MSLDTERDDTSTGSYQRPSSLPWLLVFLVIGAGIAGGYFGWQELNAEKERSTAALKASDEAAARADERQKKVSELEAELEKLKAHAEALSEDLQEKEAELEKLKATYDSLEEKMRAEIKKGEIQLSQSGGRIRVDMVDKILFDSGEAELSARGQEVLGRLGAVLAKIEDRQIQVAGHTDDAAISDRLKEEFPTNWELSVARAVNVVRHLAEHGGVPPARLLASGHGEFQPIASNATPAGRARNRRIEILLTPSLQARPAEVARPSTERPVAAKAPPKNAKGTGKSSSARKR